MMQIMREHSADGRDILDIASHSAPDFQMDKNSRNVTDLKKLGLTSKIGEDGRENLLHHAQGNATLRRPRDLGTY